MPKRLMSQPDILVYCIGCEKPLGPKTPRVFTDEGPRCGDCQYEREYGPVERVTRRRVKRGQQELLFETDARGSVPPGIYSEGR